MVTPAVALDYVKKMGASHIEKSDEHLVAGIGGLAHGLTVEEATSAYSSFPNAGVWKESYLIDKIVDRTGKVVYQHKPKETKVLSPQAAYVVHDMMQDTVRKGTAAGVGAHFPGQAIAGKTGTTDGTTDSWFVGYSPAVTLGVWIGYDIPYPMDNLRGMDATGGRPIVLWNAIMDRLYKQMPTAGSSFPAMPSGVVQREVCTKSGKIPTDLCRELHTVTTDLFVVGTEPKEPCDVMVKVKYFEINGKKYLLNDKATAFGGVVKEGIFIKRDPYTVPAGFSKPLDADLELPKEFGKDGKGGPELPSLTGLKITNNTATAISLGWDSVQGADGYVILRSTSPTGPFDVISEILTKTEYTDPNVKPGTTYYYQAAAVLNGTVQPGKDTLQAIPGQESDSTGGDFPSPAGLTAVSSPVGITVSWRPVPEATQYILYRSSDGRQYEEIAAVSGTSYQDVSMSGASTWYKVAAKKGDKVSNQSPPVKVGGGATDSIPSAPTLSLKPAGQGSIQLSWTATTGAVTYVVERSSVSSWQEIAKVTGTGYTDSNLSANAAYSYRVRAVDSDGHTSSPSNVVSSKP